MPGGVRTPYAVRHDQTRSPGGVSLLRTVYCVPASRPIAWGVFERRPDTILLGNKLPIQSFDHFEPDIRLFPEGLDMVFNSLLCLGHGIGPYDPGRLVVE